MKQDEYDTLLRLFCWELMKTSEGEKYLRILDKAFAFRLIPLSSNNLFWIFLSYQYGTYITWSMQVLSSHNFKKVIEILTCISEMQVLGMQTLSTQAQKASS